MPRYGRARTRAAIGREGGYGRRGEYGRGCRRASDESTRFRCCVYILWFFLVLYEHSGVEPYCGVLSLTYNQTPRAGSLFKASLLLDSCIRTYRADVVYKRDIIVRVYGQLLNVTRGEREPFSHRTPVYKNQRNWHGTLSYSLTWDLTLSVNTPSLLTTVTGRPESWRAAINFSMDDADRPTK